MKTIASTNHPEMTFPEFHNNSNSPQRVGQQYFKALQLFHAFEEAFFDVEFHSRDYYTISPDAFNKANEERVQIAKKMTEIRQYIDALSSHCFESAR